MTIIFSCAGENQRSNSKKEIDHLELRKESISESTELNILDIESIFNKLENKEDLSEDEYSFLINFTLNNKDESLSEGLGYLLFEYLRGEERRNKIFSMILDKDFPVEKDKFLSNVVFLMCIDLSEENYTYAKLIKDFTIFKNNKVVKDTFNKCIKTQEY